MPNFNRKNFESIVVISTGFLILYLFFKLEWQLYVSLAVGVVSVISPVGHGFILWVWDKIAHILGWINTRILLSSIFFLFLLPIALLTRMVIKNLLQLSKPTESTFTNRNHTFTNNDLKNMW
jgi:hypothetical protein